MKRPPAPSALATAFARATGGLRGVAARKMFGFPAVFVNGNMIAGLVRDRMVIRLAANDRERFLALPGAAPFIAMKGRVMKQWTVVPQAMVRSPARLRRWLARALAHGRSLPPKPVRQSRPRAG
jgi:TfoX/Sxy family transcriptional regulator of competence genes